MPASSSQLAPSALHRRMAPKILFRPCHHLGHSATPAARKASAPHNSQNIIMQLLRHVAACARKQAPHRRVDEVAHAGHKHPRHERLDHQQKQAEINGEPLSDVTNLVRAEIDETIWVNACRYTSKIENSEISEKSQQPNLQKYSASTLHIYRCAAMRAFTDKNICTDGDK